MFGDLEKGQAFAPASIRVVTGSNLLYKRPRKRSVQLPPHHIFIEEYLDGEKFYND
jgi:hypothetical protein